MKSKLVRVLLDNVPASERPRAVREAITSIEVEDAAFALELLNACPDDEARQHLLEILGHAIFDGRVDAVLVVCQQHDVLRVDLFHRVVDRLHAVAGCLSRDDVAVQLKDVVALTDNTEQDYSLEAVESLLVFACTAAVLDCHSGDLTRLAEAALVLLGVTKESVSLAARDVFFVAGFTASSGSLPLWQCVQKLISSGPSPFYVALGYAIWLRWTYSASIPPWVLVEPAYWQLLRQGLRASDTERRKQCLGILRRSTNAAVADDAARRMICANSSANAAAEQVVEQYERYCTVFETILLGRYLNQVLACEADLNLLRSSQSAVTPEWLYTLLTSALAPKIQESNRKFIGNWIMRSAFQPDKTKDFIDFFQYGFIPWATQGSLFTSSLRQSGGFLRCAHGEDLADYIAHLLRCNVTDTTIRVALVDALLTFITDRRVGSFAYASMYLLEGLGRALDSNLDLTLTPNQTEKIADLASWPALPEVAREYVLVRCLRLCDVVATRSEEAMQSPRMLAASRDWKALQANLRTAIDSGSHRSAILAASRKPEPSRRDIMEKDCKAKCQQFETNLASGNELAVEDLKESLEDIWSDVEYLEYPKGLLILMPKLVLGVPLVKTALTSDALGKLITTLVSALTRSSENRVYMLSPLVCSIRNTVLACPEATSIIPLKDVIMHYAEQLPVPNVDLRLEDSTVTLLRGVDIALEQLSYEHYFGDRESVGVAALMDLISRLGPHHDAILDEVQQDLIQRWAKQRNPPPTVSAWKWTLQLQIMLLCLERSMPKASTTDAAAVLKDLLYIVSIEPLPRYRYLFSWMMARICLKHSVLKDQVLLQMGTKDHHSNPKYLASLMKLGVMLAKVEDHASDFAIKLASALVPLAASSKVIIRHEGQWQVPLLVDHARTQGWTAITDNLVIIALDDYIRSLERFDDPPIERQLDHLDPIKDHTMTNLMEGRWYGLDIIETPDCSRADFRKLLARDRQELPPSCIELGEPTAPLNVDREEKEVVEKGPVVQSKEESAPAIASESLALQTKGTAYLTSDDTSQQKARRNNIIVVASLVDNPYNLGGLSRVSEIFGASELHLQNQNVTSNKDFVSVAVSSHLHYPICQLSASAVSAYLAEKRSQGWTIVGIEQTDRSVLLGSAECILPEKVVLVIGSEKEGIPALVLSECNLLVEIPQQGITRSLNVQTAAGIVLYEYARQHRISSRSS